MNDGENAFTREEVFKMQNRPFERKISVTFTKLLEVCLKTDWKVAVSFSGGKDSAVLLDMTSRFWGGSKDQNGGIPLQVVFANTGNEHACMESYIRRYCERCESLYGIKINLHIVRPKVWFGDVVKNEGYPVGSKRTARSVRQIRKWITEAGLDFVSDVEPLLDRGLESARSLRALVPAGTALTDSAVLYLTGYKKNDESAPAWLLSRRWRPLITAPFKVSERCCDLLKKAPIHLVQKELGLSPITAEMADDSVQRMNAYMKTGCNAFSNGKAVSKPMGFWLEQDVLRYIKDFNIPVAPVYGTLVEKEGRLSFSGEVRTGCKLCLFGIQFKDNGADRVVRLNNTEPATVKFAMKPLEDGGLGYMDVLTFLNTRCKCHVGIPEGWKGAAV